MNELFAIPESKSPRLLWMEKHQIRTIDNGQNFEPGDECEFSGNQLYRWCAYSGTGATPSLFADHLTGWGDTEADAILEWAVKNKIKLWNEA